jgi:hypothetical protein
MEPRALISLSGAEEILSYLLRPDAGKSSLTAAPCHVIKK